MQTQDIRQLAAWLTETDIDVLELHGPNLQIRIQRDGSTDAGVAAPALPETQTAVAVPQTTIHATSVGLLLERIPGRPTPLCPCGSAVETGQLLGLLQIGYLLLPVHAPCNGWAGEWLVPPGTTVGYDTPLLHIFTEPVEGIGDGH